MMNGYNSGLSMGFGRLWMIGILVLIGLLIAARVKYLRKQTKGNPMDYTINRLITGADFDAVDARTRAALATHGFGILTEIDVKTTMKKKLDVDMPAYRILGACNPKMALEAIGMEPRVGAMLPCNVILREVTGGVEVNAIDPVTSMQTIDNPALHSVAGQVRDLLSKAVAEI
jgi:uncharacterized protein (DUF302 family)